MFVYILDIDECYEKFVICLLNVYCRNIFGLYECICGLGYWYNVISNICDGELFYFFYL